MISTAIQRCPIHPVDRWTQSTGSKTWRGHCLGRECWNKRFHCLFKGNAKLWWTSWEYHTGESTEIMLPYIRHLYLSLASSVHYSQRQEKISLENCFQNTKGWIIEYGATHLHLIEFEWFLLFLYASFLEGLRDMLLSGLILWNRSNIRNFRANLVECNCDLEN